VKGQLQLLPAKNLSENLKRADYFIGVPAFVVNSR
jgi:hypothetical protein